MDTPGNGLFPHIQAPQPPPPPFLLASLQDIGNALQSRLSGSGSGGSSEDKRTSQKPKSKTSANDPRAVSAIVSEIRDSFGPRRESRYACPEKMPIAHFQACQLGFDLCPRVFFFQERLGELNEIRTRQARCAC